MSTWIQFAAFTGLGLMCWLSAWLFLKLRHERQENENLRQAVARLVDHQEGADG